jgi:transposase
MRGSTDRQMTICTVVDPGELIPEQHPIRRVRPFVESALSRLEPTFEEMYAKVGRPSIPPEQLLKAGVLMALYSIRSERQFCERLQYDLLFKWFLGLNVQDPAFDATTFSKNRERLMDNLVSKLFFQAVLEEARQRHLLSNQHFTVDGTLLESWASLKSLERKPNLGGKHKSKRHRGGGPKGPRGGNRNPEVNWRGEKRSNETHQSKTDPEARLARKGAVPAKLCYAGHVLMENRNGLVVDLELTEANGRVERETGLRMLHRLGRKKGRITVGADKGFDSKDFVQGCRELGVTPHIAQNTTRFRGRSAIDGRTVKRAGYAVSQRMRKRIEEIFGWWKTVGGGRRLRFIGRRRNQLWAEMTGAAFNLVRMSNLVARPV